MKCKNTRYDHECHPHYAKKYHGYCLDCANAGIDEADDEIARLKKERDDALSGDEHRMLMAYIKRIQERHGRPRDGQTYHEIDCPSCHEGIMWCNGNEADLTAVDIDAIRCWSCGFVIDLETQMESEVTRGEPRTKEELEEHADKTFMTPRAMTKRNDSLSEEIERLKKENQELRELLSDHEFCQWQDDHGMPEFSCRYCGRIVGDGPHFPNCDLAKALCLPTGEKK